MPPSTPIRRLCLRLALSLAGLQPGVHADSIDIPSIEVPRIEVAGVEIDSFQIPSIHIDLDEINTQLAALNVDLQDVDIDLSDLDLQLDDINLQLQTLDLSAIEDIARQFENGWPMGNDLTTLMRSLELQKRHRLGVLPFSNPAIGQQLKIWDDAIAQVEQALAQSPEDPQLMRLLEQLYRQQFDYLEQLAKADPVVADYY